MSREDDAARLPAQRRQSEATSHELIASIEITRFALETMSEFLGKIVRAELDGFDGRIAGPLCDGLAEAAATRFVRLDGNRIAYRSFGEGQPGSVPIVRLQRFRASMDDWDPALIDAVASDRRVILFDNVGVGESDGQTPGSPEQMADDAAADRRSGPGRASRGEFAWAPCARSPEPASTTVPERVLAGVDRPAFGWLRDRADPWHVARDLHEPAPRALIGRSARSGGTIRYP